MLTRIVLKILFKACLPLVAVVGIMSYMMYLNGGDPKALIAKVFSGAAGQARSSMQQAGQSARSLTPSSLTPSSEGSSISTVHKWVDSDGVTHFSSSAPANVQSQTMRVNANANVVASTPKPKPKADPSAASNGPSAGGAGQVIPGTGGLELPVNLNRKELTEFLEKAQRPSTER